MPEETPAPTQAPQTGLQALEARYNQLVINATTPELTIDAIVDGDVKVEVERRITLIRKGRALIPTLKAELNKVKPLSPAAFDRNGNLVSQPTYDDKAIKKIKKIGDVLVALDAALTTVIFTRDFAPLNAVFKDVEQANLIEKSGGKDAGGNPQG